MPILCANRPEVAKLNSIAVSSEKMNFVFIVFCL